MATKPNQHSPKGGSGKGTPALAKTGEHLDLSHIHIGTAEQPARTAIPQQRPAGTAPRPTAPAQTAQAPAPVTPAVAAVAEEDEPIPEGYTPPDEESEDDPNAPADLDEVFGDENAEEGAPTAQTVQTAGQTLPTTNSALLQARQFLAQREQIAASLRQDAANKRDEAQRIMAEAQERATVLQREAGEAEALAASMTGTAAPQTSAGAQAGTQAVRRRRRRQGVPNPPVVVNDTAGPVAGNPHQRAHTQAPAEETTSKAAQTRALNQGKSVRLGILYILKKHKCIAPGKTMALKPLSELIVSKPEQGGYGYVTQSSQFGNVVRGQLDKLEQEGKVIFDDPTGGYYLSASAQTAA